MRKPILNNLLDKNLDENEIFFKTKGERVRQ